MRVVVDVGVVGPCAEPLLIVLDRYWKMSCNLDNLSCPAWSGCILCLGDRGEKSDVTGDTGPARDWFDSSSAGTRSALATFTKKMARTRQGICDCDIPLLVFSCSAR